MEPRKATDVEQVKIDQANSILHSVGLEITQLQDKERGTVLPNKGF